MMASRNCALAKYLSPRSRCWVFLASGDLEHPVMTINTDIRRAIPARAALHILVSAVKTPGSWEAPRSLRPEKIRPEKFARRIARRWRRAQALLPAGWFQCAGRAPTGVPPE